MAPLACAAGTLRGCVRMSGLRASRKQLVRFGQLFWSDTGTRNPEVHAVRPVNR